MEREKPYLGKDKSGLTWDWWKENPVEIILVVFILVLFLIPRTGCGITPKDTLGATQPVANVDAPADDPASND